MFPTLHASRTTPPVLILDSAKTQPFDSSITESNSKEVAGIFSRLRQALLARQSSISHPEAQQSLLLDVDCSILQYLSQEPDEFSDLIKRTHATLLAAQVFMYATLRHVPPKSTLMRRMVKRLQLAVGDSLAASDIWVGKKPALMWIAFIGLLGVGLAEVCPEVCPEGQWYLSLFKCAACADSCANCVLSDRDIREIFSAFLWDEAYCQPVLTAALHYLPD